jgi:hypothetical protein
MDYLFAREFPSELTLKNESVFTAIGLSLRDPDVDVPVSSELVIRRLVFLGGGAFCDSARKPQRYAVPASVRASRQRSTV